MHPRRYPKHQGNKGQVLGGECNVTRCHRIGARYWNQYTYGLYCASCAKDINWQGIICYPVEQKPETIEDMERPYQP